MALDKNSLAELYAKRASLYDLTANAYYILGFREFAYRKDAILALELKRGDTVVEIGCGTGLNFSRLIDCIGPEGKLIGVDLTAEMLKGAASPSFSTRIGIRFFYGSECEKASSYQGGRVSKWL